MYVCMYVCMYVRMYFQHGNKNRMISTQQHTKYIDSRIYKIYTVELHIY